MTPEYWSLIKPMLASPPKTETLERLAGTHLFDTKLDGTRALLFWDGQSLLIRNRSGIDVTHRYPELEAAAPSLGTEPLVLDGEIVACSGSFQDTARRDKQNKAVDVVRTMHEIPIVYVAFDLLHHPTLLYSRTINAGVESEPSSDLRLIPYQHRRTMLDELSFQEPFLTSIVSPDPAFFEQVKAQGMEGVIAKRKQSTYRAGRFSEWIKFKAIRSITAIGMGYEQGTGSRTHFGAMRLALLAEDGRPVEVGRVGTGFTVREIAYLKNQLDAGQPVICEIECLNVSRDGQLRFPVYKSLRTDKALLDCTLDQLEEIPRM